MENKEKFLEEIESRISVFETEFENNCAYSVSDYNKLERVVNNLCGIADVSEEQRKLFLERLEPLKLNAKPDNEFISKVSPRNFIVKHKKLVAVITAASLMAAAGAVGCTITSHSSETETVVETSVNSEMDEEYRQMADRIAKFMNDSISKGLKIDEENKMVFVQKFVDYYMLNNMDSLTDEQWGNVFQNSNITADDLMNSKFALEWIDEQRVTVAKDDMILDYSLLFGEKDAKLLQDAASLLNEVKTSNGVEKTSAINEFKNYISENLGKENNRMLYSERALDTFRAVYFDAFDELTEHNAIDDELEHAINTTITCSLGESELDVKDKTIKSLQSDFEIYEKDKLEKRLERGWQFVLMNKVNKENSRENIVALVSEKIDLSQYKELPNYEDEMTKAILTNDGKSNRDSGISDGQGGIIDANQLIENGIKPSDPDAKIKNEEAVINKTNGKVENKDISGQKVTDPELMNYYVQLGASDYYAGLYDESKVPSEYVNSYRNGKSVAVDAEKKVNESLPENTTEFVPVDNGSSKKNETVETYNFVGQGNSSSNSNTETQFIPVDGPSQITESIETMNYSSLTSSDLDSLRAFRNELQSMMDADSYGKTR